MNSPITSTGKYFAIIGVILQITDFVLQLLALYPITPLLKLGLPFDVAIFVGSIFWQILSIVGLVLILIALMRKRFRAKWFFWFNLIYGVLMLIGSLLFAVINALLLFTQEAPKAPSGLFQLLMSFDLIFRFTIGILAAGAMVFSLIKSNEFFQKR